MTYKGCNLNLRYMLDEILYVTLDMNGGMGNLTLRKDGESIRFNLLDRNETEGLIQALEDMLEMVRKWPEAPK